VTPAERVARANDAKRILDDPFVAEAFASVEAAIIKRWRGSKSDEAESRERLYWALQGLAAFRQEFHLAVQDGKVAQHDMDGLNKNG
jgi:hypothetical protein